MPRGRPALDEDRRKVTVGVRVLPAVRDRLEQEYGSAGRGMAAVISDWAKDPARSKVDPTRLRSIELEDMTADAGVLATAEEQAAVGDVGPHRHKRGRLIATTYELGVSQKHYSCAIPGCQVTLH